MKEALSSKSLGLGLFTFYMAQCAQSHSKDNLNGSSNIQYIYNPIANYGRKQMYNEIGKTDDTKLNNKKSKIQQYQQRQEKLHKFLINCVGAAKRNPHNNVTYKNETQRYSQPISAMAYRKELEEIDANVKVGQPQMKSRGLHSIHLYTNADDPLVNPANNIATKETQFRGKKKQQKKVIAKQCKKSSTDSKHSKSCSSSSKKVPIATIQLQNSNSYQSSHKSSRKQIKIKSLQISDDKNKLSIGSKKGKYQIKANTLQNEQKNESQNNKRHTNDELYDLKNGLKELKLFNQIYPRLVKHNSQKSYAHQQPIGIASICKGQYGPSNFNFNKYKKVTDSPHNYIQLGKEDYSLSKKTTPAAYQRSKQKTVIQKNLNLNQSLNEKPKTQVQPLPQIYPLLVSAKASLCKNENILIQFGRKKEKKAKRLQIIVKNGKNSIIKCKKDQHNEEEKKVNQIYYSIDNKQKKVPEINLGLAASNRLLDGWEERKKQLLQKMKESYNKNLKDKELKDQNQKVYRLFKYQKDLKTPQLNDNETILHIR